MMRRSGAGHEKIRPGTARRGTIVRSLTLFAAALLLSGCHTGSAPENHIIPVVATLTMDTPEPAGSPLVFPREVPDITTDDIVTVNLILRPSGTLQYRGFTLEVDFDPGTVQLLGLGGDILGIPTAVGRCPVGGGQGTDPCDPFCQFNLTGGNGANSTGKLLVGVYLGASCLTPHVASGEETVMTLGFRAATNIRTPQEGRITLVEGAGHGDCEILDNNVSGTPTDLGITFNDRNMTIVTN